jgi:hypothetical protein
MRQVVRYADAVAAAHIVVERGRGEKNNICIEIQSHAQDFPALSVHFFTILLLPAYCVCAHIDDDYCYGILFSSLVLHVLKIGSYLILLSASISLQTKKSF